MHPLDNIIWKALTTRHAGFSEGSGQARRFVREVSPLTAMQEPSTEGFASLADLVGGGGSAYLFLDEIPAARDGWSVAATSPLVQMIYENGNGSGTARPPNVQICELGERDSPEMLELTALTKPGPFNSRTHELGTYLGIRSQGRLVSMAGERLKVPGYTEVSAVCTHPDHLGKGYAALLMTEVMEGIRRRGEVPFLHVRQINTRAIGLYERLGFRLRRLLHYAQLKRM